jgi:hypothetical protein
MLENEMISIEDAFNDMVYYFILSKLIKKKFLFIYKKGKILLKI